MSDQPSKDFFTQKLHDCFANTTHFIDEHIRIFQYGAYCVAVLGTWRVLHSVRAFTKFQKVEDIPTEFIRKNVRLRGRVAWAGNVLPVPSQDGSYIANHFKSNCHNANTTNLLLKNSNSNDLKPEESVDVHNVSKQTLQVTSEAAAPVKENDSLHIKENDNRNILRENLSNINNGENKNTSVSADAKLNSKGLDENFRDENFTSIYLLVEHIPALRLPFSRAEGGPTAGQLLPIKLAAIEVAEGAAEGVASDLQQADLWLTLLCVESHTHTLHCAVARNKFRFAFWKTLNEDLVSAGDALVVPFPPTQDFVHLKEEDKRKGLFGRLWPSVSNPVSPKVGESQKDLVVVKERLDSKQHEPDEPVPGLTQGYLELHRRLTKAEARASKKMKGIWFNRNIDKSSVMIRIFKRFVKNTKELRSENQ